MAIDIGLTDILNAGVELISYKTAIKAAEMLDIQVEGIAG